MSSELNPTADPVDLTGRTLGNYLLLRRLGKGGMADVYLAEQASLGRQVAFKTLKSGFANDEKYLIRFAREAKAAAALNHANIVQIYEVGEIDGVHYIVQEYIRGQNLKQYLQRHSVMEPVLAVNVVSQVAAALQIASARGVIHRDIKPENIMLTPEGDIKVTDFGLARVASHSRSDLTQVGITMGTPLYMSPEQVEGHDVDVRSDIYSLGVTIYHALAGRPPFESDNPLTLAVKHIKNVPPPLSKFRPDLPESLCQIVETMMAKRPEDRFQTAGDLLKEVRQVDLKFDTDWETLAERLRVDEVWAEPGHKMPATQKLERAMAGRLPTWYQQRRTWLIAAGILMLGFLGGAVWAVADPPQRLLPPVDVIPVSERQATPAEQYRYAYTVAVSRQEEAPDVAFARAERAWKQVREFFPPDEEDLDNAERIDRTLWARRADERLGELYLRHNDWDKAREVYGRLVNVNDPHFRLVGLAGMAVVFANQQDGQQEDARELLFLVEPDIDQLNEYMRDEIRFLRDYYFRQQAEPTLEIEG